MEIKIHVYNTEESQQLSKLGIEKEPKLEYTTLIIKDRELRGYWVSTTPNPQTKKYEITIYALGETFICDCTPENIKKLNDILDVG